MCAMPAPRTTRGSVIPWVWLTSAEQRDQPDRRLREAHRRELGAGRRAAPAYPRPGGVVDDAGDEVGPTSATPVRARRVTTARSAAARRHARQSAQPARCASTAARSAASASPSSAADIASRTGRSPCPAVAAGGSAVPGHPERCGRSADGGSPSAATRSARARATRERMVPIGQPTTAAASS